MESLRLQRAGPALRVFLLVDLPEIPLAVRLKAASLKAVVNLGLFCFRNPKKGGEPLTFSATGKEEVRKMKKKPAKYFKSIVDVFDNLEGKNGEKCLISDYCIFEAGFYKLNPEDIEEDDPWFDMVNDLFKAAFAIGYVFGQSFDIPYPEIRKDVEAVKKVLKDEKLLPYFPREKKTA